MNSLHRASAPSNTIRVYMSGPIEVAKQVLREECLRQGLCVTIQPTLFVYTGGEETGFVVGFENYPRFPLSEAALLQRAEYVTFLLLDRCAQHSAMLVGPLTTVWVTRRAQVAESTAADDCVIGRAK